MSQATLQHLGDPAMVPSASGVHRGGEVRDRREQGSWQFLHPLLLPSLPSSFLPIFFPRVFLDPLMCARSESLEAGSLRGAEAGQQAPQLQREGMRLLTFERPHKKNLMRTLKCDQCTLKSTRASVIKSHLVPLTGTT